MKHDYRPNSVFCPPASPPIMPDNHTAQEPASNTDVPLGTKPAAGSLRRLLERMHNEALAARRDPIDPAYVILVRSGARGSLSAGRIRREPVDEGLAVGCLVKTRQGLIELADDLDMRTSEPETRGAASAQPRINDAESPLLWLYRRKGPDGQPLLDELSYLAGERFRRDVTQASMLPSVTTNWSRMESSSGQSAPRDMAHASDVTIAARQRVRAAFQVLGSDMGHFVLDVCAFLMPLQEAEARRSWPARSAKLVLRVALTRLAQHYGLSVTAQGPASAALQAWQVEPERVSMQSWLIQSATP